MKAQSFIRKFQVKPKSKNLKSYSNINIQQFSKNEFKIKIKRDFVI